MAKPAEAYIVCQIRTCQDMIPLCIITPGRIKKFARKTGGTLTLDDDEKTGTISYERIDKIPKFIRDKMTGLIHLTLHIEKLTILKAHHLKV